MKYFLHRLWDFVRTYFFWVALGAGGLGYLIFVPGEGHYYGGNTFLSKSVRTQGSSAGGYPAYYDTDDGEMDMPMAEMEEAAMDYSYAANKATRSIAPMPTPMPPMEPGSDFAPGLEQKIIRNASLDLMVEASEEVRTLVESEVRNAGGAITNLSSWQAQPGVHGYRITAHIPAEKLDVVMQTIAGFGEKRSEHLSASDITAQYADTENQLENLRSRRERLREIMEQETGDISDILQVENELSRVQFEIQSLENTQRNRDASVQYSTLNITLTPKIQVKEVTSPEWSPMTSAKEALNELISQSQDAFDRALLLLARVPQWGPILLILWAIHWWINRRRKAHK